MSNSARASKRRKLSHEYETPTKSIGKRTSKRFVKDSHLEESRFNDGEDDELQEIGVVRLDQGQNLPVSTETLDSGLAPPVASDDEDSDDEVETVIRVSSRQRKAPRRYSNEMLAAVKPRLTTRPQGSKASSPAIMKGKTSRTTSPAASQARPQIRRIVQSRPNPVVLTSDRSSPSPSNDALQDNEHRREASPELDVPIYTPTEPRVSKPRTKPPEIAAKDVQGRQASPEFDVPSYTPQTAKAPLKQPQFNPVAAIRYHASATPMPVSSQERLVKSAQRSVLMKVQPRLYFNSDKFDVLKNIILMKLTNRRLIPLVDMEDEFPKVHGLLKQTVALGEGNSMLIIGARGTGKTALINTSLRELVKEHGNDFHVIRLNGFIHTDDKLALREIWHQLGQQMDLEDDVGKNYADTLATLLALLSQPVETEGGGSHGEQIARSVVFIVDEFDLFTAHSRQTLLYNLFDIAQSRSAPIAVLGLTTRVDVAESLEKRVKSRFSQRYVHVSLPKNLATFTDICRKALQLQVEELDFDERAALVAQPAMNGQDPGQGNLLSSWNASIETLLARPEVRHHLASIYHTTKSLPTALSLFLLPATGLSSSQPYLSIASIAAPATLLPPDSKLQLLPALPTLSLALLIAAARLDIILDSDTCNFNMAYEEYCALGAKARVSAISSSGASAGVVGVGGKVAGRAVARAAWEKLVELELLIPAASGVSLGLGGGGVLVVGPSDMTRCDVRLEEIEAAVPGLEKGLVKWCREI